ncbi:Uncharacterised protein [Staphylococcus piscifermentans]|uniref:DUF4887 domain-containing protein n=1 Tax=Staphylococcus piscifermentans TaxID=70258 RepID=A0A239TFZ2_9STAP|nr:hypothetical protein [Staphylococcus piscifermentans]RTX85137.1 hypothetical protein CD139_04580 [Staphylococcus piscifermentans]GEP83613.1 hypothetical protein SPI02_01980 [Staphylococcus piscifermentans]SNU96459.1 Uncharacterised protein [Staphylococcus piscifermentans]
MGKAFKRIAAVVVTALLVTGIAVSGVIAYQKYMKSDQASALKYYEKKNAKDKETDKDKSDKKKKVETKQDNEPAQEGTSQYQQDAGQSQQTQQRSYYVAPKQEPVQRVQTTREAPKETEKPKAAPVQPTQNQAQPKQSQQPAQPQQNQTQNNTPAQKAQPAPQKPAENSNSGGH